jgi:transaldolase
MLQMGDQLEALSKMTVIVADTGDIDSIKKYTPTDATTNPSLMLAAASDPKYKHLIEQAVAWGAKQDKATQLELTMDKLAGTVSGCAIFSFSPLPRSQIGLGFPLLVVSVTFGVEILKIVSGVVSTEVDARLSFDTKGTVARARSIIKMYEDAGSCSACRVARYGPSQF